MQLLIYAYSPNLFVLKIKLKQHILPEAPKTCQDEQKDVVHFWFLSLQKQQLQTYYHYLRLLHILAELMIRGYSWMNGEENDHS